MPWVLVKPTVANLGSKPLSDHKSLANIIK